jgi:hypothetical protein
LQDFKATTVWEYIAYGYLYCSLIISLAVYGVDTFTAVNLLAFDSFTGIKPAVPLNVSKWIFSGCIIASWVNLIYEQIRAIHIIRRGAVAESYLDSLAVRLQSIRMGKGRGWRRFLVFSELTKSKKGAEYIALFTYFGFQSWIRVIFCSGPRQVINALTLRSVYMADLNPADPDPAGSILNFFKNFGKLAEKDKKQAVILSGMLFTLVIWVFAALSLLLSVLFFLLFLWHYIPNGAGGLSGYCEGKINGRLKKIVSVKVNKAIEEEERKRLKASANGAKDGTIKPLGRQATIPMLFDTEKNDKQPTLPMLNRNDTNATLPLYESRPATPLELNNMNQMNQSRPPFARYGTSASGNSGNSYASNAPLTANAADMGHGRSGSPAPSLPPLDRQTTPGFGPPQRTMTGQSNGSQWNRGPAPYPVGPPGPGRSLTQGSAGPPRTMTPMQRQLTPMERTMSPASYYTESGPSPPYPAGPNGPLRINTQNGGPVMRNGPSRQMTQDSYSISPIESQPTLPQLEPSIPQLEPSVPQFDFDLGDKTMTPGHTASIVSDNPNSNFNFNRVSNDSSIVEQPRHRQQSSVGSQRSLEGSQGRRTPAYSDVTASVYSQATGVADNAAPYPTGPARNQRFPVNPSRSGSAMGNSNAPPGYRPPVRNYTAPVNQRPNAGQIDYFGEASQPQRAGTAAPNLRKQSPPRDYFGEQNVPGRAGTAPPRPHNGGGYQPYQGQNGGYRQ